MQISISGQHVDITDAMRTHVNDRMEKIARHFDHVTNTHVVLQVEKNRHKAEANISARGIQIHAAAESDNMYSSIDSMTEKLDRQVIKHKEKQTNHHTQPIEPEVD